MSQDMGASDKCFIAVGTYKLVPVVDLLNMFHQHYFVGTTCVAHFTGHTATIFGMFIFTVTKIILFILKEFVALSALKGWTR